MAMDGFKPDRYDVIGALVCLVGVSVIMCAGTQGFEPAATNRPRTVGHDPMPPHYNPKWTVRSSRVNPRRSSFFQATP
jgi:hypothetical protein